MTISSKDRLRKVFWKSGSIESIVVGYFSAVDQTIFFIQIFLSTTY